MVWKLTEISGLLIKKLNPTVTAYLSIILLPASSDNIFVYSTFQWQLWENQKRYRTLTYKIWVILILMTDWFVLSLEVKESRSLYIYIYIFPTVIWYLVFLSNANNLHTVVWFQVFLSNTNNYMVLSNE